MSAPFPATVPTATYRLQFSPSFGFVDATALVPYLAELGIGAIYASPYLRAMPGSEHGYDIIDHNALNPELGSEAEYEAMIATAQTRGIGHILDFVPNHMGVGFENPWWRDVLEWGERSPYAHYFDIDWRSLDVAMYGKVLLPFLGDQYGAVLERGELQLAFEVVTGSFALAYFAHRFPLGPRSYGRILDRAAKRLDAEEHADAIARLRAIADDFDSAHAEPRDADRRVPLRERLQRAKIVLGELVRGDVSVRAAIDDAMHSYDVEANVPASADALDRIVQEQSYRLAFWRVAVDEINYRRFFDINSLAGLRQEDAEVLGRTHERIFRMIGEGKLQGLRIDHVDGLANPAAYVNLLQERAVALGQPLWIVVEKILAREERLRTSWSIAGATGYEFANLVNGLFVDASTEASFTRIYHRVTDARGSFADVVHDAKRRIMRYELSSELSVLASELYRIARSDRRTSDFTLNGLRGALFDVIAAFRIYRTYVTSEETDPEDVRYIDEAVDRARAMQSLTDASVFRFIGDVLTLRTSAIPNARYDRDAVVKFAMRFQQYTSPVMAKSVEDTAFYRYPRLLALNEVGGDPSRFGTTVEAFHEANVERARLRPHAMLATSTHDHKRGEDARTRIDALTEFPAEWSRALRRWGAISGEHDGPSLVDEYALTQTLVATWPADWSEPDTIADDAYEAYVCRIVDYQRKAIREAKVHSSWGNPNERYEARAEGFTRALLARGAENRFLPDFVAFVRTLAPVAAVGSLAQVVMKLMSPGVPDIYQGCEFWDQSLVDPDNRRAVDYRARYETLVACRARCDRGETLAFAREVAASWPDARIKLYVTWTLLRLRAERRATFLDGPYDPLTVLGSRASALVAFRRTDVVVVVPRLARRFRPAGAPYESLAVRFGDEEIVVGDRAAARYRDVFTGVLVPCERGVLRASELLAEFPVAVLVPA